MASALPLIPVFTAPPVTQASSGCGAALFAEHLHSRFRATDEAGRQADLELTQVHEVTCDPSLEQFSLVFEGRSGDAPLQGICGFDHAVLDPLTIFVTSEVARRPGRSLYVAAFNRRRDAQQAA